MEDKLTLIKQAVDEWIDGKLTASKSMLLISMIINREKPSEAAINWAKTVFMEINHGKQS